MSTRVIANKIKKVSGSVYTEASWYKVYTNLLDPGIYLITLCQRIQRYNRRSINFNDETEMTNQNYKNWTEVDSKPKEFHHSRQPKGSTSNSTKRVVVLKGICKRKTMRAAAVSIRNLTTAAATAPTQISRQLEEEQELFKQGRTDGEIKAIQEWLDWLDESGAEINPEVRYRVSESESGPELSLLAQRAITVVNAGGVR